MSNILKNAHHDIAEPEVTSPNRFFRSTASPKAKDSSFIFVSDKEMQKTLQVEKLEQARV